MSWTPGPFDPDPGALLNIASGVLLVGLAIFVASVKPRRRANLAFAGFSAGWGLYTIVDWTFDPGRGVLPSASGSDLYLASQISMLILFGAAMAFLALVAMWFPQHVSKRERPFVFWAALGAGLFGLVSISLWIAAGTSAWRLPAEPGYSLLARLALMVWDFVGIAGRFTAFLFALLLLALRAGLAHREGRDAERRQYVLMTVALVLNAGTLTGIWARVMDLRVYPGSILIPAFVGLCTIAGLWLSHTRSGSAQATRTARNVAFLTIGLPVASWIAFAFLKALVFRESSPGLAGVSRTLTVLVLAYAILRHQLLGTDVKLRWTISRGTVAAAFITAFFVASEGAQILFGQGNEWVGLLAAGGLVFAIAPLQRAAERLAEKAVPVAPHAGSAAAATRGADTFRRAVRLALKDRTLTHDEELDLATVAHDLGLTGPEATRIRLDIERELRTGGAAAFST